MEITTHNVPRPTRWSYVLVIGIAVFALGAKTAEASALQKQANNLGLVLYMPMNEGTSTKAGDFSGKGNKGTLTNMASPPTATSGWTNAGKIGGAINFDGVDDYVDAGNLSSLRVAGDKITISVWVNPRDLKTAAEVVNKIGNSGDWAYGIELRSGRPYFRISTDGTTLADLPGSTLISTNSWYHLVGVYDGASMYLYINGTQNNSALKTGNIFDTSSETVKLGTYGFSSSYYFNGLIDEVRIYNRALGATEVASLYNNSRGTKINSSANTRGPQNGLVGMWSFDGKDISGTTAYDRASTNNGTLTNGPVVTKGKMGQALKFDGTDDYVAVASSSVFSNITGAVSIAAWVRPVWEGQKQIAGRGSIAGGATNRQYVLGGSSATNKYRFTINNGSATYSVDTGTTVSDNTWVHLVGIYDGSSAINMYLNGALSNTTPATGTLSLCTQCTGFTIGAPQGGTATYFNGSLDDVRIYNRALSQAEVTQLYNLGGGTTVNKAIADPLASNLVLWHTFDGQKLNTTTSTDSSASANNGTLSGGPRPAKGKLGQALKFDGVDDYVAIASTPSSLDLSTLSISMWVKNNNLTSSYRSLLSTGLLNNNKGFRLMCDTNSVLAFEREIAGDNQLQGTTAIGPCGDRNWHHVVATISGTSLGIYIDGAQGTILPDGWPYTAWTGPINSYLGTAFNIGTRQDTPNQLWNGSIDDVRVYNKALTAGEVAALYNATK